VIVAAVPARGAFAGSVEAPASKSHTNRAFLLAALADHPVSVLRPLDCDDAEAMLGALAAAGVRIARSPDRVVVSPGTPPRGEATLDVRASGTACRFLTAYASATPGLSAVVTGSPRLLERPIGALVDALRRLGAEIDYLGRGGFPPLSIRGRELSGGAATVESSESSQFASALLLIAPRLSGGLSLSLAGRVVSRAYLETTRETLEAAGIAVRGGEGEFAVPGGQRVAADTFAIPGDYSSGASLAAAVAVAGGTLRIAHLPWPSSQADAKAFDVLEKMGVRVDRSPGAVVVAGPARLPLSVDAADFPDAVPVLSSVAARVAGESVVTGIEHLRLKESDRLGAIEDLLRAAGVDARADGGALRIGGAPRRTRTHPFFPTRDDHRIVMAAALLAIADGGFVESPRAVEKSYPAFFEALFAI